MTKNSSLSVLHPASSIDAMVNGNITKLSSAKGIWVKDSSGHDLIDGTAGLWCVNVGHGRPEIAQTLSDAAMSLDYFHTFGGFSNDAQETLGTRLAQLAPANLNHVFFGSSGSDANDTLLKIIWHYNNLKSRKEKKHVIARWGAYHGTSISTASLTGLVGFHNQFDLPIAGIHHISCPHYYRFAENGEDEEAFSARLVAEFKAKVHALGADRIAAFVGEPLLGAGGVVPPPADYWAGVQEVCQENDILLVADEVVCGYGRTGNMFGSETFSIAPDMMATAKGLTSGVFPMSAAYLSDEIYGVLHEGSKTLGGFSHGYTYSGHPIGAAVANTVLDIIEAENLVENAGSVGAYLMQQLTRHVGEHPNVGEIRGAGMVCAVQLVADKDSRTLFDPKLKKPAAIAQAAYDRGLIVRPLPSIGALAFSPPLTLSKADADMVVQSFTDALTFVDLTE